MHLQIGLGKVCLRHQSAGQHLPGQIGTGILTLAQIQHTVRDGIGLTDGVPHIATVAPVGICTHAASEDREQTLEV
jgi:hypothetical protein